MRKTVVIFLLVAILVVGGCSKPLKLDYTYRGEGGDWSGEYKTVTTGSWAKRDGTEYFDGNTEVILTLTYKKDVTELAAKHILVSYDTGLRGGSQSLDFQEPSPSGTFTLLHESEKNFSLETEYSVIKITIDADGSVQTLELKYDK